MTRHTEATGTGRDALAAVIAGEDKPCRKALAANPNGCVGDYGWCLCRNTADAVLASDWFAAVVEEAERKGAEKGWDEACEHDIATCRDGCEYNPYRADRHAAGEQR